MVTTSPPGGVVPADWVGVAVAAEAWVGVGVATSPPPHAAATTDKARRTPTVNKDFTRTMPPVFTKNPLTQNSLGLVFKARGLTNIVIIITIERACVKAALAPDVEGLPAALHFQGLPWRQSHPADVDSQLQEPVAKGSLAYAQRRRRCGQSFGVDHLREQFLQGLAAVGTLYPGHQFSLFSHFLPFLKEVRQC